MPTTSMPEMLRETMSDFGVGALDHWWEELDDEARHDVIGLWRSIGFGEMCGVRVNASVVEDGEADEDPELWHNDFYEYLVNHEICFSPPRVFHVCARQPMARSVVSSGLIPGDFRCPIESGECPMHRILEYSQGKSVLLRVGFTRCSSVDGTS